MLESLSNKVYKKDTSTQVFSCEYGVILKAPGLKNIYERLLLLGRTDMLLRDFEVLPLR